MTPTPDARGSGARRLAAVLGLQSALVLLLAVAPPDPAVAPPPPDPLQLAAALVVEPAGGGAPRGVRSGDALNAGDRLQLSFEGDAEAWVAVLWFDGPDRVVPLYPDPARRQNGWTTAGDTYVVPGPGAWLRATPTRTAEGDFVAVVAGRRPDPAVVRALADPTPAAVGALRAELERSASARSPARDGVERFLPTSDGRAVAVPWTRVAGTGRLVIGTRLRVGVRALAAADRAAP